MFSCLLPVVRSHRSFHLSVSSCQNAYLIPPSSLLQEREGDESGEESGKKRRESEKKTRQRQLKAAIKKSGLPVMCMIYGTDHTISARPSLA
jgi:hypothetical protein